MRRLADRAGVHPTTMVRLARRLDYPGYNAFRDVYRERLRGARYRYSSRARELQSRPADGTLMSEVTDVDIENIRTSFQAIGESRLRRCARLLLTAGRVYLLGQRGCFPIAFFLYYALSMFRDDVLLVDGAGGTAADTLRGIREGDALIAISFTPYTRDTVGIAGYAASYNAKIIAITDSSLSPLTESATEVLIVGSGSPSFFQSITAAQAVAQALIALAVADAGEDALARLAEREKQLDRFSAYWEDSPHVLEAP